MRLSQIAKVIIISVLICSVVVVSIFFNADEAFADVTTGEQVFKKQCLVCHADSDRNKIGPSLVGVVGRVAGAVPNFNYSRAMKDSGLTWDRETLAAFLAAPQKLLPGTKMAFVGLKNGTDTTNVIEYLETLK